MPAVAHILGGDKPTPDAYVRCRSYNHAWDEYSPIDLDPPQFGWRLSLRCIRCTTERHDNIAYNGRLIGRRYIYPDGYRMAKDEMPSREVFREELFSRLRSKLEKSHALGGEVIPITKARRPAKKAAKRRPAKAAK